jgi:hypothetical protein
VNEILRGGRIEVPGGAFEEQQIIHYSLLKDAAHHPPGTSIHPHHSGDYSATGGLTKNSFLVLDCCKAFMDSLPQIFMNIRIGYALFFVIPESVEFVPMNDFQYFPPPGTSIHPHHSGPYSATGGLTKKSILVLDCWGALMEYSIQ